VKLGHYSAIAMLVVIASIMALFAYWLFLQPNPVTVADTTYTTNKTSYHRNEVIEYTFSYCKSVKSVGTIDRALTNDFRITFASIQSDLAVGCHTVTSADLVIPSFIPSSKSLFHVEGTASYVVNPLRTEHIYWTTNSFQIE